MSSTIFSLHEDVLGVIFSHTLNRDRFGAFAMTSRAALALALAAPIRSLDLFSIPKFAERYSVMLDLIAMFGFSHEVNEDEDGARLIVHERVVELFSSSFFLSRANLASVVVLELTESIVTFPILDELALIFRGCKYIKLNFLQPSVPPHGTIFNPPDEYFDSFSKFPNFLGASISLLRAPRFGCKFHKIKYLDIHFFDELSGSSTLPDARLLSALSTACEVEELHIPFPIDISNLTNLTDLRMALDTNAAIFVNFRGMKLKRLSVSPVNYHDFPDLNPLRSSLESLVIHEFSSPPSQISPAKFSQLNLKSLALLGTETSLSLDSFKSQTGLVDLAVNARVFDDHFIDRFFNSLKSFSLLTSLSLAGPMAIPPLKKAVACLVNLRSFSYDENAPDRFNYLNTMTCPSLLAALPRQLEELKLHTKSDVFNEAFFNVSFLPTLKLLRVKTTVFQSPTVEWLRNFCRLGALRALEISQSGDPNAFLSQIDCNRDQIFDFISNFADLQSLYLGDMIQAKDLALETRMALAKFPSLRIFELKGNSEPLLHPEFVDVFEEINEFELDEDSEEDGSGDMDAEE